ncbi:MAG: hypothetical protein JKY25_13405 [Robiginitomaculum sp.]|nr:hypothetical protein [Robiginitomaculum sp.]
MMKYTKLVFPLLISSFALTGCIITAEERATYANKSCQDLLASVQPRNQDLLFNTKGPFTTPNDIIATVFQTDEQKQQAALRSSYSKRCVRE